MTAGIRGNNPGVIEGREVVLAPPGPDGWQAMVDRMALGKMGGERNARTLWVRPGGGYSYATSSIHIASIMLRHIAGMEMEEFIRRKLATPMGWGHWTFGYRRPEIPHTPGGGGIAPRATDMLRFNYLLLRQGRWKERQLVPADYVRHCSRPSRFNPHYPYSLQFHVNDGGRITGAPRDAFWKLGSGGHAIYVIPSLELVIYKLGGRDGQYNPDQLRATPPASDFRHDSSREGWTAAMDANTAAAKTLELVVAAVTSP